MGDDNGKYIVAESLLFAVLLVGGFAGIMGGIVWLFRHVSIS